MSKGSFFSIPLSTFVICVLFDDSHYDQCEQILECCSDLNFSDNDIEHLFLWISSTSEGSSIRISELIFMPLQTLRGA